MFNLPKSMKSTSPKQLQILFTMTTNMLVCDFSGSLHITKEFERWRTFFVLLSAIVNSGVGTSLFLQHLWVRYHGLNLYSLDIKGVGLLQSYTYLIQCSKQVYQIPFIEHRNNFLRPIIILIYLSKIFTWGLQLSNQGLHKLTEGTQQSFVSPITKGEVC